MDKTSIDYLNLTYRTYNCLKNAGIKDIGTLIQNTEYDLRKTKGTGDKAIQEIKEALHFVGLKLAGEIEPENKNNKCRCYTEKEIVNYPVPSDPIDKLKLLKCIFGKNTDEELLKAYTPNIEEALQTLTEREQYVLYKRFSGMTLKAIGLTLINMGVKGQSEGVTPARVREIQIKALRQLKHPIRLRILRGECKAIDFLWKARTKVYLNHINTKI